MNKLKDLKIGKKQYLKDIIAHIEINIILFKFLCGIGATSLELEDESRNSILIVPNRPVIEGKSAKYNSKRKQKVILGVYEGVTKDDVIEYLESDVKPKKIITTPESFRKVKEAMIELDMLEEMYNNYFIMFDECERTIQDIDYRKDIIYPMDDFFKFTNKAFVSATPILPSDPRFKQQGFNTQSIKPNFNHKQNIKVNVTNNVFYTFKKHIEDNEREQYFIFLNSTNTIAYLIKFLQIADQSAIFCSKESRNKLKLNHYKNVNTSLTSFKKYNFFTSRFFSAVDIEGVSNPHIILLSDLVSAEHSMIDPMSEAVQIIGRFRKPEKGTIIKEVTHITNVSTALISLTEETILQQIKDFEVLHCMLRRYYKASHIPIVRNALLEMMTRADFAKYINVDGTKNYFMLDNTIYEEKIKGYYQCAENLNMAYQNSNYFNIQIESESYTFTDQDRVKIQNSAPLKTTFEVVMPLLKELFNESVNMYSREMQLHHLKEHYPEVIKAFNIVGLEKAKELDFNPKKIRAVIREKERNSQKSNFGLLQHIENNFIVGQKYSSGKIKHLLKKAIVNFKLSPLKPNIYLLKDYCELSKERYSYTDINGKEVKGYEILKVYDAVKGVNNQTKL